MPELISNATVYLLASAVLAAALGIVIFLEIRARQPHRQRIGISRGVHARLQSVVRHRIDKLRLLSPEELRQLPASQRERKVSYNGRKFSLTTLRSESRQGAVTISVEADARRFLLLTARVSESFVVPSSSHAEGAAEQASSPQ